jgi:ferredoxin
VDLKYLNAEKLNDLLLSLTSSSEVFVPKVVDGKTAWQKLGPEARYKTTAARVEHPLKGFFFPAQEKVGTYPAAEESAPTAPDRVVVGAKACDLVALKTYDKVFGEGDVVDDFYLAKRQKTTIIAADCPEPLETCGCSLVDGKPFPEDGFDLCLSEVEGGFVVEVGSEKGRKLAGGVSGLDDATEAQQSQRKAARGAAAERLQGDNTQFGVSVSRQELVRRSDRDDQWREGVSTCVECGACLFACPTCYCFLLHDYPREGGGGERAKAWDACIYGGYHLMAGGGSPRADLVKRFRNRWMHKFDYFVDAFGFESCSGCGRCISGCPGKIDLRKVIKSMEGS